MWLLYFTHVVHVRAPMSAAFIAWYLAMPGTEGTIQDPKPIFGSRWTDHFGACRRAVSYACALNEGPRNTSLG